MSKEKKTWEEIGEALYEEWVNRPAFTYTPTRDAAYIAARDAAVREARAAARDAEARAAARTGGYGSTYAGEAGAAAADSSMRSLEGVVDGLYDLAYGRYKDEGDAIYARMKVANEKAAEEKKEQEEAAAREEAAREEAEKAAKEEAEAAARAEEAERKRNDALRQSPLWPTGFNPAHIEVPKGEWVGTEDAEGIAVMLKAGVAEHVVEGLVSRAVWTREKLFYDRDGTKKPSTYGYDNYEQYLRAYVNMALGMTR